jgi:Ca2+/Na+ antiporter
MAAVIPSCTHDYLFKGGFSSAFQCSVIANETCSESVALLNFYNLFFCTLDSNPYIFLAILFIFIILIFRYIGTIVEDYIAEGVTEMSKAMGLSESLAAVTLIAFAGGAGELITSLVAGDTEGGISYNIGHIFGSGLFIAAVLLPICGLMLDIDLIYSKTIIFRDVGFYILTILVILAIAMYGEITWWNSSILLGLYVIMVMVTVFKDLFIAYE